MTRRVLFLRLDPDLHASVKSAAKREGLDMSAWVTRVIKYSLSARASSMAACIAERALDKPQDGK